MVRRMIVWLYNNIKSLIISCREYERVAIPLIPVTSNSPADILDHRDQPDFPDIADNNFAEEDQDGDSVNCSQILYLCDILHRIQDDFVCDFGG